MSQDQEAASFAERPGDGFDGGVSVEEREARAAFLEDFGDGLADFVRRPGDNRHFAGKIEGALESQFASACPDHFSHTPE